MYLSIYNQIMVLIFKVIMVTLELLKGLVVKEDAGVVLLPINCSKIAASMYKVISMIFRR